MALASASAEAIQLSATAEGRGPSLIRASSVIRRIAKRGGIEDAVPYLLRHSAASLLIDQGVSIEVVADLLGDDPKTLYRHYRHRVRPVVDAALAPMERLFGADGSQNGSSSVR